MTVSGGRGRYPPPENLARHDLREEAEAFLREFWPEENVPVDIDHIVDVEAGLNIVWEDGIFRAYGLFAYLASDREDIFVDSSLTSDSQQFRYRLALAREIAHWYLHDELYAAAQYADPDSYLEFQRELTEQARSTYEWQANVFADMILVPATPLHAVVAEAIRHAHGRGFRELDLTIEAHQSYVAEWIGRRFEVPAEVILRRCRDEAIW